MSSQKSEPPFMGMNRAGRWLLIFGVVIFGQLTLAYSWKRASQGPLPDPSLRVDANTAPREVLMALPKLGPVLTGRIVAAREIRPFDSIGDLDDRVKGVGPVIASAITPYLRFEPTNP